MDTLIKLAISGDRESFEKIIHAHYDYVFKVSYKLCLNREDAEDITHEVFIKLTKSLKSFRFDSKFSTWLCQITINTHKDFIKSKAYRERSYENIEKKQLEDQRKSYYHSSDIKRALQKLTPKLREAVVLVHYVGLNHSEAARALGCSEKTVSWRIHEAKKRLRELL